MRYMRFRDGDPEALPETVEDRELHTLEDLAAALSDPDYHRTWVEGLGSPTCANEQTAWKVFGKFIREKVIPLKEGGSE